MSSAWVDRSRVARMLSRTGPSELVLSEKDLIEDYASAICSFRDRCSVDARAIATGSDGEFLHYDAVRSISGDFAEIIWSSCAQNKMWHDMAMAVRTPGSEPAKIFMNVLLPVDDYIRGLSEPDKEYTFINNIELYYFERFFANNLYDGRYGDLNYSVADVADVMGGDLSQSYDLVRIHSRMVFGPTFDRIDAYMDMTKVGGMFIMSDASEWGEMYVEPKNVFKNYFYDLGRHVASDENFITYHVPYDIGMIVSRRIS